MSNPVASQRSGLPNQFPTNEPLLSTLGAANWLAAAGRAAAAAQMQQPQFQGPHAAVAAAFSDFFAGGGQHAGKFGGGYRAVAGAMRAGPHGFLSTAAAAAAAQAHFSQQQHNLM